MNDEPEDTGKLEPGTEITAAQVAEAMRKSVGALATQMYDNVRDAMISPEEIMVSIAQGALAWSVDAYLRYWAAQGAPTNAIRANMNRAVAAFWKQSIEYHLAAKAELAAAQPETPNPLEVTRH